MRRFLVGMLAAAAVTLAAACGGHIILDAPDSGHPSKSSSSDDGGDSASPPGDPGQTPFPVCPEIAPETGSACPTPNQGCVYDDLQAMTCASWTCDADMHWVLSTPAGCTGTSPGPAR